MPTEASHSARHPFAVYLLGLCVVSGLAALAATAVGHPTEPEAIVRAVPEWARLGWYGLLILGASVALSGACRSHRQLKGLVAGLLWERYGVIGLGMGAGMYGLALVVLDGWVSKYAGIVTLLFALACAVRIRHVSRDLRRLAALLGKPAP